LPTRRETRDKKELEGEATRGGGKTQKKTRNLKFAAAGERTLRSLLWGKSKRGAERREIAQRIKTYPVYKQRSGQVIKRIEKRA